MEEAVNESYKERKRILFFGLPWTFTKYAIREDMINTQKGFLKTVEDDCYMYKITDVKLEITFWERLFKLGTVVCFTGDVTDATLRLEHIKNSRQIKDFILKYSESERLKRRTLNTQNIGSVPLDVEINDIDHVDVDDL